MDFETINEIESDIENALDNLEYDLSYEIEHYTTTQPYSDDKCVVFEVTFDIDNNDKSLPDDWDDDVEDAIDDVCDDWGGSHDWDGKTISICIDDDDDADDDKE